MYVSPSFTREIPTDRLFCGDCGGRGKYYRIEDNDPVEGYKMAEKVTCKRCNGFGLETTEYTKKSYEDSINMWRKNIEETKGIIARQKAILKIIKDAGLRMKDIEWLMKNSDV